MRSAAGPCHSGALPPAAILPILVAAFAFAVTASPARAQSPWLDTSGKAAVQLEILKPFFEEGTDLTFATSTWYLNGSLRVGPAVCLRTEIPFAHSGVEDSNAGGTILGNPYFGARFGAARGTVQGDVGVRLPLAPEDDELSALVGIFTDPERLGGYLPDVWTLHAVATIRSATPPSGGTYAEMRLGPELELGTSGGSAWWAPWAVGVGVDYPTVRARAEFNGNTSLDGLDEGFSDATFSQFAVGADFGKGSWRPGVTLRLPLNDNLSGVLDAVVGVDVQYRVAP